MCVLVGGMQIIAAPRIQQIHVTQQKGSSCGYHAVYNAQSVETLVLDGTPITSSAVIQEARQYQQHIQRNALITDELIDLANQLDIDNFYCVDGGQGLTFAGSSAGAQDGNRFLQAVRTQNQHINPLIGHFIVNTGGHWVVFSVIKESGEQPVIIYTDSLNTPLSRNRVASTIGNALVARLGGTAGADTASRSTRRNDNNQRNLGGRRAPNRNGRESDYVPSVRDESQDSQNNDKKINHYTPTNEVYSYKMYIAAGLIALLVFSFRK
jgi:hypothetical protein